MSLINDALKRASSTKPAPSAPLSASLQPVTEQPRGAGPLPLVLCIVGIGALIIAAGFWIKAKGTAARLAKTEAATPAPVQQHPAAALPRATVVPAPAAPEETTPHAAAPPVVESVPPKVEQPVAASAVVKPAEPAPVVTRAEPPKAAEPDLKLQAVYYRFRGPTVVINGKTLKIGDSIEGAKLVAIERTAATVEVHGKRQRLTLP